MNMTAQRIQDDPRLFEAPASAGLSAPDDWVHTHGSHLLRYAYSRVRNSHVAEELVQETFIAGLKGKRSYSGRSSERTWFIGILRHKIIDYFRKSSRERAVADVEDLPDADEHRFDSTGRWLNPPENWNGDPEQAAEASDFWSTLRTCIDGLPPNLASAFVLREIKGLGSEEVCRILDITPNNLWVRLHRARTQLRLGLEQRWFGGQRQPD